MADNEKFYVFYNKYDFIRCCGTSRQLVEGGYFKNRNSLHAIVSHIRQGTALGTVAVLEGQGEEEKYHLYKCKRRRSIK